MKEQAVQNHIRLKAAQMGLELWRNNSGVLKDDRGVPVRFGLGNDSKKANQTIKSSDLIGITPVTITPDMVGQTLGVFTAIEVKGDGWQYRPNDKRSLAQKAYIDIVRRAGGIAGFARSVDEFEGMVRVHEPCKEN